MRTAETVKQELRDTDMGKLLVRYGFEPYDTESAARRVAERAAADISKLVAALENTTEALKESRRYLDLSDNESFGVYETTGTVQSAARDAIAHNKL